MARGGERNIPVRRSKRRIALVACVASSSLALAACSSGGVVSATSKSSTKTAKSLTTVSFQVYAGGGLQAWPAYVAQKEGLFKRNGIQGKIVPVNTGPEALAALTSGQLDMVQIDAIQAAPLIAQGHSLGIVMGNNALDFSIVGGTGLGGASTYPADMRALNGKTVGVLALGGVLQDLGIVALQNAGLSSNSVRWEAISTGGLPADLAAVKSGQVNAIVTSANDNLLYQEQGGKVLLTFSRKTSDTSKYPKLRALQGITDGGIWSTKAWMTSHPKALKEVRLSLMEADVWMHNPKHLHALTSIVKGITGIPGGLPTSKVSSFVRDSLSMTHAAYPKSGAQAEIDFAVEFGLIKSAIPVSQFYGSGIPNSEAKVKRDVAAAGGI